MPVMLYFLSQSLLSEDSYANLHTILNRTCSKCLLWAFSSALLYHALAGIRHVLMDLGLGEHLATARRSANLVIILAIILAIFLGIWIW